jgi:hypothetical protein
VTNLLLKNEFTSYRIHSAPRNDHKQYMEFDITYSAVHFDGEKQTSDRQHLRGLHAIHACLLLVSE